MYQSRLKEELNFERCADFGAHDGDGKAVTILNRLVTWANLSGPWFWTAVQPNKSPNRTGWEFGKCKNVEILECIYVMNRQTEEDPTKVNDSCKFLDDKTEMAGIVRKGRKLRKGRKREKREKRKKKGCE